MSSNQPHPATDQIIAALTSELNLTGARYKSLRAENERLQAALQNIRALAAKRQHEGGPDGNLKTIEEFAVYGLKGKNP